MRPKEISQPPRRQTAMAIEQHASPKRLIKGLGWFSIGLGLAEIAAPNIMAKVIGVKYNAKNKRILRIYGARELGVGIGILSESNLSKWLWVRFAGDLLDLSSLAKAMTSSRNNRMKAMAATAAVAGVTVADARYAMQLTTTKAEKQTRKNTAAITSSIIVNRSAEDIYRFWRDFSRLSEILDRLEPVEVLDDRRSHWKFALAGRSVEWHAEITDDQPNSRIAWQSVSSSVPHRGEVRLEPTAGQRGTKVTVRIQPGGLGKLIGFVPEQYVNVALHNLKQLMEIGEIAKSDASIHRGMHAACPPEEYPGDGKALGAAASA